MEISVGAALVVLLCGAALGALTCNIHIQRNYSLCKNVKPEPRKMIVVAETIESIKSKKYLCPWCGNAFEVKLFPTYFSHGDLVGFNFLDNPPEHQTDCPKCKHQVVWPNIHNWYDYAVRGKDNYKKICEHLSDENIDWEDWLRKEKLID